MALHTTRKWSTAVSPALSNPTSEPGDLKLSECQIDNFDGWKRPSELFPQQPPEAGASMTASKEIDLVQDITTDCSVVASLCAGTARAVKGHGKV